MENLPIPPPSQGLIDELVKWSKQPQGTYFYGFFDSRLPQPKLEETAEYILRMGVRPYKWGIEDPE